ncbi:MAG: 5-(carboxyamino)imidazole ribonucleotide mutase [Thermoplasmatales archaeon]|jgi:5-(carboxyamino)imidazole ribonucleotide mutase
MPEVAIIMGSKNDYDYMKPAEEILIKFGVSYEKRVVSAHRTPEFMMEFAKEARGRGVKVIIAAAGGAAHLPGMTASFTTLPVIGVPIPSKNLKGLDSLLSIVQMPFGVPVATVAIDGARNAALLAIRILGLMNDQLNKKLEEFREEMKNEVLNTSL